MGDTVFSNRSSLVILDPENPFVHPAELERSEVYLPDAVVDLFESDILAGERVGDADPVMFPADAAVATDEPDFEVTGILERRKRSRQGRRTADRRRPAFLGPALRAGARRCTPGGSG